MVFWFNQGEKVNSLLGSIEAGGTKFVCALGRGPEHIHKEISFPTKKPQETIREAIQFFRQQEKTCGKIQALGIGCFGPVNLDKSSPAYGSITSTPKKDWENTQVYRAWAQEFDIPIGLDTDVNVAALGEWSWGAAQGLDTFVYLTFGTGVGGGGMSRGQLLHGLVHPEMGHMKIPHDIKRDPYLGNCPFHGDCWEGLASGPAIEKRWGQGAKELPSDHAAWKLEAEYIAVGLLNIICVLSPQKIILGGGVMQQGHLFDMIRKQVVELLNGYVRSPAIEENIHNYIVPPELGNRAGILGGLALAQQALNQQIQGPK